MSETTFDMQAARALVDAPLYGDIAQLAAGLQEALAEACAEVERLRFDNDDLTNYFRDIMATSGHEDEMHCTCVPGLRREVERLQLALDERMGERDKYVSEYDEMLGQRDELAERASRYSGMIDRLIVERDKLADGRDAAIVKLAEMTTDRNIMAREAHKLTAERDALVYIRGTVGAIVREVVTVLRDTKYTVAAERQLVISAVDYLQDGVFEAFNLGVEKRQEAEQERGE